ncbi:hypothetical protein [Chromobacterium subtsugae]|uniref:hypothetical protein n=1 Tax=Chromobacterium subtsugae TaxID=251747 RepID=UPI000AF430DD|nr:hypothetical protein [Chromobacterium subtsugae]
MALRVYFFWKWSHIGLDSYGNEPRLWVNCHVDSQVEKLRDSYGILLGAISSDFSDVARCDKALSFIERLASGEILEWTWEGQNFFHDLCKEKVLLEHAVFGECPEWPILCFPLDCYEKIIKGWKMFLEMPRAVDSCIQVDLDLS